MAKQLIVSVNGREKKIAIIEDDKVTEFYIERGEQHQGIVNRFPTDKDGIKSLYPTALPGMWGSQDLHPAVSHPASLPKLSLAL